MSSKRSAPAAERNCCVIVDALKEWVPETGRLLEIASGTGQHALAFAEAFTSLEIQPTELQPDGLESIEAYRAEADLDHLMAPVELDVTWPEWPVLNADIMVAINLLHISPWATTLGLLDGAQRTLGTGGLIYLYGPYFVGGEVPVRSNVEFDLSLKYRNPEWGIRELAQVTAEADDRGFDSVLVQPMPANNLSLVYRKRH